MKRPLRPRNYVCHALLLLLLAGGLGGQVSPSASDLPSNQQVLAFLTETIDWYRHRAVERQVATDPVDLVFQEDDRQIAVQVVQLSFEFAKADADFASRSAQKQGAEVASGASPDLAQFLKMENETELTSRQASEQIEDIRKKLLSARRAERGQLQAALDATQSRLDVLQAASASLHQLVEFMRGFGDHGAGDLGASIDNLARSVPDVTAPATAGAPAPTAEVSLVKPRDSGILALSSEVSALERKLRILDDEILRTEKLRQSSDALRSPVFSFIARRFLTDTANNLQTSDLTVLQQQKVRLDDLAGLVKALSPAIVALDKQKVLLDAYTSHLKGWRAAVVNENEKTWKNLILRLAGVVVAIAALVIIGVIARRVTNRHVHDSEHRHIIRVTVRVVVWFAVFVVTAFSFASDLRSLATFLGLLTAGLAVALQSFILSAVGYFVLVGRRGIRLGDRVQISGVTGDVSEIGWLQFQVREIDPRTQQPTGNVVTFSNSLVLASPSTGVSKFSPEELKPAAQAVAGQGRQS